jgi:hypothetical protein
MAYVVNVAITDTLVICATTATPPSPARRPSDFATVEAYQLTAPGTTATVTLAEIGSGEYRITFTPTTPTSGSDVDLDRPPRLQQRRGLPGVQRNLRRLRRLPDRHHRRLSHAVTGGLTQTLAQLRIRVADRFGDRLLLTANEQRHEPPSSTPSTSTPRPRTRWGGRSCSRTAARGGSPPGSIPPARSPSPRRWGPPPTPRAGRPRNLFNKRGKGFLSFEYDSAINAAINDAYPIGADPVRVSTITPAFDGGSPEVTVPASDDHVKRWSGRTRTASGTWCRQATRTSEYGWLADPSAGELRILGDPAWMIDGFDLRITGYGRQDVL